MAKRKGRKSTGKASKAHKKSASGMGGAASNPEAFMRDKDLFMLAIAREMEQKNFETEAEANAFLNDKLESYDEMLGALESEDTPESRALAELDKIDPSQSEQTIRKHANAALKRDPKCIDAYLALADTYSQPKKVEEVLRKAVRIGRERFPDIAAPAPGEPDLWSRPEYRPLMKACGRLASLLSDEGEFEEAISLFEEILRWNPDDNLGARFDTLKCYLSSAQWDEAERHLGRFPDEEMCDWSFGRAFLEFMRAIEETEWLPPMEIGADEDPEDPFATLPEGAFAKANDALRQAVLQQPWVPTLALDFRATYFQTSSPFYRPGAPSEALSYARRSGSMWVAAGLPAIWMLRYAPEWMIAKLGDADDEDLKEFAEYCEALASIPSDDFGDPMVQMVAESAEAFRDLLLGYDSPDRDDLFADAAFAEYEDAPPSEAPSEPSVYQLKITLKHIKPPIWRRIQVPGNITLDQLHCVIQEAMGWHHGHLYCFEYQGMQFEQPIPWNQDAFTRKNSGQYWLSQLVTQPNAKLLYTYDFGDDWRHEVLVEKIFTGDDAPDLESPVCIKGKRNCPLEDCGGVPGYYHLLEALSDPEHPEHEELKDWAGDYDAEDFDMDWINQRLKTALEENE